MRQASKHAHATENVQQSAVGVTSAKLASVHEDEATNAPRGGEKEQRGNETRGWTVVGGLTLYLLAREVVHATIVQVLRFRRFLRTTSRS
jgi:hypothetical protein